MKYLKGRRVLVTGGTGFVGSHLVEELVLHGALVITTFQTINPLSYFFLQNLDKKSTLVHADVRNFEKLFEIVTKYNIEYIFHLAAQALVEPAYYNPRHTIETNVCGTTAVLECARLYPQIKAVVVASSDKAYGKLNKLKYRETDALRGDHPYEVSKSAADLISYSYFQTYNVPSVVTRFGNIYGEGDLNFSRIIPGVMKALISNEPFLLRSNGKHVRDYLYVKDVVRGYLMLAQHISKVRGEAYNFGSRETLTVLEVVKTLEKTLVRKVNYKILNTAKNEIPYQSLDYSKIHKQLNWKPVYTISSTAKKMESWYKQVLK